MNRYLGLTLLTIAGLLAVIAGGRAGDATLLPNAMQYFMDANGKPLANGKVYFYTPSTTTAKTTWTSASKSVAQANPVVLGTSGRPTNPIYGEGSYRQIVKDQFNNTIWDFNTASTGGGSSGGGGTATGDGDLVGTIKPWAGLVAPNQYMFAYGQAISRTTYSALFTAITQSQSIICTNGLNVLSGIADTTQLPIGGAVEASCIPPGTTITAKAVNSVTVSAAASVSTAVTATFFLYGNGDGSSTFNLPDFRGRTVPGRDNMGGTASARLSATYFGSNPAATGATGGTESKQITQPNLPTLPSTNYRTFALSVTSTPTNVIQDTPLSSNAGGGVNRQLSAAVVSSAIVSTGTGAINAVSSLSLFSGGRAIQASIAAAGSGYTNGSQTITVTGGTCTVQPQFTITVTGNAFSGTPALLTAGNCSVSPANPASTSGGGGSGGTLNVFYDGVPISLVQPSITMNYIIKVTPDTNSATASGVTSFGGMTGDISCGSYLLCTSNVVSVLPQPASSIVVGATGIVGGTDTGLLYNNGAGLGNATSSSVRTSGGYQFFAVGDAIATGISRSTGTKPTALMLSRLVNWSGINDSTLVDYTTLTAQDSVSNQYASFAAYPIMTNTAFNWNHLIGFEDLGIVQGSGTLTNQASFYSAPTISGTTTNRRGLWINDAGGVGTLTNQYGIYIEALTRGSTNWGLYSNSAGYFGAKVLVGTANANALTVGPNGATNPSFNIDTSTASAATGLNVKSAAATGGLAVSVLSSGSNENLTLDAKGSGTMTFGGTSTGAITLSRATTASVSLTTPIVQSASTLTFNTNGSTYAGKVDANQLWMIGANVTSQTGQVLTITQNTAAPAIPPSSTSSLMYIYHRDGTNANVTIDSYGTSVNPGFIFRAARGTAAAPTQSQSGDFLSSINSFAFNNASAFQGGAGTGLFGSVLTENCTTTACGTKWVWYATSVGTVTLAQKMQVGSGLSVGTTSEPGDGMIYTNAATFMIRTKTSYSNGAAAGAGTITNAPAAGNPTKWIPVDDNGTTRYIPAW